MLLIKGGPGNGQWTDVLIKGDKLGNFSPSKFNQCSILKTWDNNLPSVLQVHIWFYKSLTFTKKTYQPFSKATQNNGEIFLFSR